MSSQNNFSTHLMSSIALEKTNKKKKKEIMVVIVMSSSSMLHHKSSNTNSQYVYRHADVFTRRQLVSVLCYFHQRRISVVWFLLIKPRYTNILILWTDDQVLSILANWPVFTHNHQLTQLVRWLAISCYSDFKHKQDINEVWKAVSSFYVVV